jgi:RNA polymerase sigma-70 factor (ECF subfamily)
MWAGAVTEARTDVGAMPLGVIRDDDGDDNDDNNTTTTPPVSVAPESNTGAAAADSKVAAENAQRFRMLVTDHFDFIWRTLRGLGVPSAYVDDAAQQVFLVATQKLSVIALGSERAFLFATARGIAANARRTRIRNPEVNDDEALEAHPDNQPDPEQLIASKRAREVLDRILDELSEDVRTVFMLYELEGMTMAEITTLLNVPHGTIASRLRRARKEFESSARRYQAGVGGKK